MKWILGILLWAGLAAFFVILVGAARLGGKRDPRRLRLVERNRRTVQLEKNERRILSAYAAGAEKVNQALDKAAEVMTGQGLGQDPLGMDPLPPEVVCLDCLWRGNKPAKGTKCPECRNELKFWLEV